MPSTIQIIVKARPQGAINASETFAPRSVPSPSPADLVDGQILVETLYLSLDPIMRDWLNADNGILETTLGNPMPGPTLARVLASRSSQASEGDLVTSFAGWVGSTILDEGAFEKVTYRHEELPLTDVLGVLGFTGLTAYGAMLRVGKPQKGETVLVSSAAGATGSVAAQLAKMRGARVVGIAGGAGKCEWVKSLGVDEVLDYKSAEYEAEFARVLQGGIDLYFDNVGGRTLELAINNINEFGRILLVGQTSSYNTETPYGIKSLLPIAPKSATITGFNIFPFLEHAAEARADLAQWLKDGTLKRTTTVVKGGLEAAPQGLVDLLAGKNMGKMLVEVKAE
ncbi:NADP-dependent leukotriene B4 12-hydroxydehydrogenase [Thelonectria olida]|uniref:Dehydrogenase FUB6 n=1 Tax=Thelonectria olida TaxID=1576542 RepID=A0A9P8W7Y7_9HYPO|nr:NADP-dependent leukotriene B4 12-hydroxydehydrogenase [Thelonectria olida]